MLTRIILNDVDECKGAIQRNILADLIDIQRHVDIRCKVLIANYWLIKQSLSALQVNPSSTISSARLVARTCSTTKRTKSRLIRSWILVYSYSHPLYKLVPLKISIIFHLFTSLLRGNSQFLDPLFSCCKLKHSMAGMSIIMNFGWRRTKGTIDTITPQTLKTLNWNLSLPGFPQITERIGFIIASL